MNKIILSLRTRFASLLGNNWLINMLGTCCMRVTTPATTYQSSLIVMANRQAIKH
ncbi:hypothetical protein [Vibrio sp. WXL103]|uniref:hypothetical protein n=1 Tax=unclassified Vibrio TaxID=2614977 RepID=UPI003EC8D7B9